MADLRIVDAPEIPTANITGEEKLPTGGSGNYSISLDSLADYTKTKKDLADNTSVDGKVNGVRQELDAHVEDLLNPHQVTKGQIGLGNVDNTADADKPVSNSTQATIISAVAPKADKTYVDNQLSLKANKADVYTKAETYTKQESSDLVNNSISTALTPVNSSLDLAKRGIANRYDSLLTYNSGERVILTNGDIVKSTLDGNANDPNVTMTGWESDFYKAIGNTGYLYVSKLKGDGTDETNAFQQELNQVANLNAALGGGVNYKCNRKGTVLISHVVMPTVTGMIIDFTGTVFKVPDGTNVLDKDVLRFNSIKKSYVFNLSMDGNSANLPDDTSGLGQWIGRCIMFRLGNGSEDCIFFNTKVVNSLYCASQWGNNISNITFQNIEFDNIGEHVFYISGTGGGLSKHILFRGFYGGSWGTNPNAALNAHECAVIKSSQTIGFNDDFAIEDSEFNQTSLTPYATVIMNNNEILRCRIKNIKVAGNITAIIYPSRTTHFCDIDGVYNLSGADNIRLVYSLPANTEIKRYTAKNIHLPSGSQVHMQVFDKLSDATLLDFTTSNPTTPVFSDGKSCVFEDVSFLGKLSILNIQHDIDFIRTKFLNNSVIAGQGLIESMGLTTWMDGRYVTFDECEFSNTSGYSWVTQNNNARVRVKGGRGIMRNPFNRAGTTMKYLDIDGAIMPYNGIPLSNVSPVFSTLRGLIGYDGAQKRNFLKWTGQVTVSSGSNTGNVNLSLAIARPILAQDVYVVAPNLPAGTSYTVSVASNLVTITLSANATSALQFLLKVDVSD